MWPVGVWFDVEMSAYRLWHPWILLLLSLDIIFFSFNLNATCTTAEYAPRAWTQQKWWVSSGRGPEDTHSIERSARGADSSAAESHTPEHSPPTEYIKNSSWSMKPQSCDLKHAVSDSLRSFSPCWFLDSRDQTAPAWRLARGLCRHHSRGIPPRTPLAPGAFLVASWLVPAELQKHSIV